MTERCTELAREWSIPVFIAQLDLKKAFDGISHGSTAEMLRRKNLSPGGGVAVHGKSVWDTLHPTVVSLWTGGAVGSARKSAGVRDGGGRNSGRFEAALGEKQLRVDLCCGVPQLFRMTICSSSPGPRLHLKP